MLAEKTLYNASRTRTLIIIVGSMILIGFMIAIYSFSKKTTKLATPMTQVPQNIIITPGAKSSEKYVELQQNANIIGTKKAEVKGQTFIPTIIGNKSENSKNFNTELSGILKEKETNNNDYERLSKQLAMLLAELNKKGNELENLLRLIRELQNQGYDVSNLESLIKKLVADGYNTDNLGKLLEKLKQQGYAVNDLENMLNKLLAQGYDPDLINKILEQLLRDRLKNLEDTIKRLQNSGIDTKNLENFKQQTNNPDISNLLEQLAKQGYKADSLEKLLQELMNKGYNIFDMNIMLQQLKQDGYDVGKLQDQLKNLNKDMVDLKSLIDALKAQNEAKTKGLDDLLAMFAKQGGDLDALKKLLEQLKSAGYSENDLKKMLQGMIDQQLSPTDIYNQLLKKLNAAIMKNPQNMLTSILNNQDKQTNADQEKSESEKKYENLIKKQQQKLQEAEYNKRLLEAEKTKKQKFIMNTEARKKEMDAIIANMNNQADQLTANLNKTPIQTFVKGDESTKTEQNSPLSNQNLTSTSNESINPEDLILKAGSILFAVMQTAVNSDEPGPILAKIVEGPLKNTTLIGSMQISNRKSEGLLLSFQTANVPDRIRSYSIATVAIDPETARTAIASDVDHHYLLKWGSVFAASFLKGYASAIAQSGNTSTQSVSGTTITTTTTQNPQNKSKQQIYQGLADVASTWATGISDYSSIPNTITIEPGTSIGLLLTADFILPSSDKAPELQNQAINKNTNIPPQLKQPVEYGSPITPATATANLGNTINENTKTIGSSANTRKKDPENKSGDQ